VLIVFAAVTDERSMKRGKRCI